MSSPKPIPKNQSYISLPQVVHGKEYENAETKLKLQESKLKEQETELKRQEVFKDKRGRTKTETN